jgi:hypothetical protein
MFSSDGVELIRRKGPVFPIIEPFEALPQCVRDGGRQTMHMQVIITWPVCSRSHGKSSATCKRSG